MKLDFEEGEKKTEIINSQRTHSLKKLPFIGD